MTTPTIFVSYSQHDEVWKTRLVRHLTILEKQGVLEVWDVGRVRAGEDWKQRRQQAIGRAVLAVLLISANYLASDLVLCEEIPSILKRRQLEGMRVIPVLVTACLWEAVPWLKTMRVLPPQNRVLAAGTPEAIEADLVLIAGEILRTLETGSMESSSSSDGVTHARLQAEVMNAAPRSSARTLDLLKRLLPAQLEEVIFRFGADSAHLAASTQTQRAIDLIQHARLGGDAAFVMLHQIIMQVMLSPSSDDVNALEGPMK